MMSSLHALAGVEELDLGAFLYAVRRLPDEVAAARVIVMGQEARDFTRHGIGPLDDWTPLEAPARRRRWYDDGRGTMAVLLASASDLDDVIPTLVAYQIEWNKLRLRLRSSDWPAEGEAPEPAELAAVLGGVEDDWVQLAEAWGETFVDRLAAVGGAAPEPARAHAGRLCRRLRAHDPPLVGARPGGDGRAGARRPADVLRLLQHALDGQPAVGLRAPARGRGHGLDRARGSGGPAHGAGGVPRRPQRRLVGQLPLLLGARLLRGAAGRDQGAAVRGGAGGRHRAHLVAHRAAGLRPGDRARLARPRRASTRGSATSTRTSSPATRR